LTLRLAACRSWPAAGCAVGPDYQRPPPPEVGRFKEAEGWVPAAPADALERGPWWSLFNDPVLDQLQSRVEVSNQNVALAVAAYAQARALVREQRASLFPTVSLTAAPRVRAPAATWRPAGPPATTTSSA
jgi:outer membrane protein TolC